LFGTGSRYLRFPNKSSSEKFASRVKKNVLARDWEASPKKGDLDAVGRYIGRQDNLTYNRLMIVIEAAQEEKQRQELRNQTRLF
jgi:hypothetical protein